MNPSSSISAGSVVWNFDVSQAEFDRGLDTASKKVDAFGRTLDTNDRRVSSWGRSLGNSFDGIARGIGTVLKASALLAVGGSFGFTAMTKAAFQQVRQVENASFALAAYEKNGKKVNQVLSQLVKYARSDTGVLFQREDLFDAASTLKLYGVETNKLVGYVKILSKGVAVGKTNFQELSDVLGRVIATGKLTGDEFDVLVNRGIKLPTTMRNAKVSAEQLFKALDKSLPDKLLTGRANTIDGVMIRLKSAFRDLGGAILGVDTQTSKFTKGGAGDRLVSLMKDLRVTLRDPAVVEAFKAIGTAVANLADFLIPTLLSAIVLLGRNLNNIGPAFGALIAMFVAAKVAAIGFGIYFGPIGLAAGLVGAAITALVGTLAFLQLKFHIFNKAADGIKAAIQFVKDKFKEFRDFLGDVGDKLIAFKDGALKFVHDRFNDLKNIIGDVNDFLKKHEDAIKQTATVLTVIFGPALVKVGIQAIVAGGQLVLSAVMGGGAWVLQAGLASAAWVAAFLTTKADAIATGVINAGAAVVSGVAWVGNAIKSSFAWILNYGIMGAGAIFLATVHVAQAAISGYAWIFNAIQSAVTWLAQFILIRGAAIATGVINVAQALISGRAWSAAAATSGGAWSVMAASTTGKFNGLKRLLANPIVMAAIDIAAPLAAIAALLIAAKLSANSIKGAFEDAFNAGNSAEESGIAQQLALTKAQKLLKEYRAKGDKVGEARVLKSMQAIAGQRAAGGPVQSGRTYLVGEKGPELFTPNMSGAIVPNDKMQSNKIEYHIGEINIAKEVDAKDLLAKLTRNEELVYRGVMPGGL